MIRFPLGFGLLCLLAVDIALAAIEVSDDLARTVRLEQPAQRIVSLAPHATELLYEVGAGGRIVGTVSFSNFPPEAEDIPRIGAYDNFDLEAIAALRPDLIVAWHSGNRLRQVERLEALGLTVFYTEARHIEDIPRLLRHFGALAGTEAQANTEALRFERRLDGLRRTYQQRETVRVFYQVWDRPLMTINGEHLISDAMRLCGGENVFAAMKQLAPTVSIESVLAADPELIVTGGMGELHSEWLEQWRQWRQLHAVQTGNLALIHPDLLQRPTSRLLEGTEALCRELERARERLRSPAGAGRIGG